MKKKIIIVVAIIAIISSLVIVNVGESETLDKKKISETEIKPKILNFYQYESKMKDEMKRVAEVNKQDNKNKIEKEQRPTFTVKIPLSDEVLDYTFQQSQKYEIPYTLVLSVMNVESEFKSKEISNSGDYGLLQLNHKNIGWISEELGIDNPKPLDEKQNITMGIWYMKYIKDYWSGKGVSDEQMFSIVCMSYHLGIEGSKRWIKHYGWNSGYVNKVLEYKSMLEQNIVQEGEVE